MRFFLDEDLSPAIAEIARGLGVDAVSAHELDRRGLGDRELLAFATGEGRVMVTRNRDDFIRLTVEAFRLGLPHPGLLIVPHTLPNRQPARIAHALKRWAAKVEPDPPQAYQVDFLGG